MAKTGHCGEVLIDSDKPKLYADLYYTTSRSGNTVTYSLGVCMYLKSSTGWRNNRWCCGITANGTNKGTNITVKKPTPDGGTGNYLGTTPFWANSTTAGAASHANTSTTTYVLSNQTTTVSDSATSIQVKVAFKETYHNYGWDGSSVSQDWGTKTFTVPIPAKYTISYAKGDTTCSGSVSSQTKIEGTNLTLQSSGFTKSGYTLIGWSVNSNNATVDYSLGGSYTSNQSITLYPAWKENTSSSGGSGSGGSTTVTTYSMTIDPNGGNMKKPGYLLFIPWIYNTPSKHIIDYSTEGYLPICTNSSSVFDNRDGDDGGVPAAYYPNLPVKDGYTLSSWKSSDGKTYTGTLGISGHSMWYVSDHNKKKNFTVTAQWTPNVYTMTVNPNGGTMYKGEGTTSSAFSSRFAYNAPTYIGQATSTNSIYNNVPWRTGYQFVKWQVTSGGGSTYKNDGGETFYPPGNYQGGGYSGTSHWVFDGKYVGNVTITAQWEGNIYYINYHSNGGSGTMDTSELTYGTSSKLRKNTFTRAGHSFIGWSTNSSATTATYTDQQSVSNLTTALEGEIDLYAVWQKDVLTINFNSNSPNGATNTMLSQSFTYGASGNRFGYNTNGTKKWPQTEKSYADQFGFGNQYYYGYKIIGWSTDASATEPTFDVYATVSDDWIDTNVSTSNGAAISLYAIWDYNGLVRIYYDDAWHMALPYIYDGSTWQQTLPYVRENNGWKLGI